MRLLVCLVGPQGCGKGTLAKGLGFPTVTAGDLLREHAMGGGTIYTKEQYAAGEMAPASFTRDLVHSNVHRLFTEGYTTVVLDGYPRSEVQADFLNKAIRQNGVVVMRLDIEVPEDQCVARLLKRGREDDTEESIRKRLKFFREVTVPELEDKVEWFDHWYAIETGDHDEPAKNAALGKKFINKVLSE